MALAGGTRLGQYEILGAIGAGGMGEVYRARDLKLQRDVALKILPDLFANDPDRLARFEREATTLASLNHPNIAQVYGVEDSGGTRALVMELVPGQTLEEFLQANGPRLQAHDAIPIARQIADALEAAHEKSIVHRDLKPANVKVKADGAVKVLDFGLAKAVGPEGATVASGDLANSPTLTARLSPGTQIGMVLGTAAYMAPEQARGRAVDRRADIWAFGVVLYEMLTGRRAFAGDDISEVMASVLKTEPDWTAIPADTPVSIRRLLRRCLEKDPRKRLSAIGDARLELDEQEAAPAAAAPGGTVARPSLWARLWPAIAAIAVTATVTSLVWQSRVRPVPTDVTRTSLLPQPGADFYPDSNAVAISPDGRQVVYVVGSPTAAQSQLWIRALDQPKARRIEGGDNSRLPFWSPDSKRIGFFADKKLKIVVAAGGRAEIVADAPFGRGAAWGPNDVIVFAGDAGGRLRRVKASGGEAVAVTELDESRKESAHRFPRFLPDGEHFLYAALPGNAGRFEIFVGSIAGNVKTHVGTMECAPVYADPGWLLFVRNGVLAAQQFDARGFKLIGDPIPLEDEPTIILEPTMSMTAGNAVSASTTGALAYFSAASQNTVATWLDETGKPTGTLALPAAQYSSVRISPTGSHALLVRSMSRSDSSLWLVDLARGSVAPFSSGPGRNDSPVWSPDGTRVVFSSDREGPQNFYIKKIGDASPEQPFYKSPVLFKNPDGWSNDGKWIVLRQLDPETAHNIWLLPTSGAQTLTPFVQGRARDLAGMPSPDNHWLSYLSEDSGRFELYVQSFPEPGRKMEASLGGALFSWWTRDGRALVFTDSEGTTLSRVAFDPTAGKLETPRRLGSLPADVVWVDAMPGAQRFLALLPERAGRGAVTIVQNWQSALRR
jgi:serine/threonine protein kinase/Tol biopolymer transport system component